MITEDGTRLRGPRRLFPETLHEYVDVQGDCWCWTGRLRKGYGRVSFRGRGWLAHRAVYTMLIGEIPAGMTLDHLCRVRNCCNPDHLDPCDSIENIRRAPWVTRTHCGAGHLLAGANVRPRRPGGRYCVECKRSRDWKRRHRAEQLAEVEP